MLNPDDFSKSQQMHKDHSQMVQQIRGRQRQYRWWFIILGSTILAETILAVYVGYKVLTHFGIL